MKKLLLTTMVSVFLYISACLSSNKNLFENVSSIGNNCFWFSKYGKWGVEALKTS